MTQLGSPATESDPGDQAARGSRLARRRRALFWVAGGAALLAIGGLQTTSATPNLVGPAPGHHGRRGPTAKPSPSHS